MRATAALRQWGLHLTFFTRENCSLCTEAKKTISKVWDRTPFEYSEKNVMLPQHQRWQIYQYDVPVVHIDKKRAGDDKWTTTTEAQKLMHRFSEADLEKIMDEEMMKPPDEADIS